MKVKAFVLAALLSTAAVSGAHAFGLGAQFNFSAGSIFAPGAALLISPSDKTNIAVNWYLGDNQGNIVGFTIDAVPLALPLIKGAAANFNFTLGVGLYVNTFWGDVIAINGGLRVPVGFSLLLVKDIFEIFTHVAPSFGVNLKPSFGLGRPFYPIALGARVWFR